MKPASPYPLPDPIRKKLGELRSLIGRLIACQGFAVLGIWLLGSFWAFGALDYLPIQFGAEESPRVVRVIMLAIFVGGIAAIAYHYFWNRWLVRWSDSALALAIEKQHPEFQSALVSTVQAARPLSSPTRGLDGEAIDHPLRPGVLALAREQALQRIDEVDASRLVRFQTLKWELIAFAIVASLTAVLGLLAPGWASHWGKRFFSLSDQPWPRTSQLGLAGIELEVPPFSNQTARERYTLTFTERNVPVPKGVPCQLKVWAERLPAPPYDGCTLYYRDAEGNRGRANMRRGPSEGNRQFFVLDGPPLESLSDSLGLTLTGGDARLSNITLEAVDAPLLLETSLEVEYPEYLQRSTKTVWGKERLPYRNGLRIPQGSRVGFVVRANKPIQRCEILQIASSDSAEAPSRVTELVLENPSAEFPIPLGLLDGNLLTEIRLWDIRGMCSTRVQQFVIASIVDNPPQVDFVLEGIGTAITEQALLPIRSEIADDYDLQLAWIDSIIDDGPKSRVDLEVNAQGQARLDLDLKAMREAGQQTPSVGSVLALMVSASDFFHAEESPHIGRSTPIQLSVVTPDQLLVILERRELAMRARVEQILSELGQLRDLLLLMNRPPEPAPENASSDDADDAEGVENASRESPEDRRRRLLVLRSQQAAAQGDKSGGELKGVGNEIRQIVMELIHNRIDSKDRRERLEQKIQIPLERLLASQWEPFRERISELESLAPRVDPSEWTQRLATAIEQNNAILAALTSILNDMVDIQDFNEVIDMVRGMLDEQDRVLERTKQEQKKRLLDALK